ncbi:MAG TPA: hypothetical protein VI006_22600, partial [Solirubrobacteraceae bacterium]
DRDEPAAADDRDEPAAADARDEPAAADARDEPAAAAPGERDEARRDKPGRDGVEPAPLTTADGGAGA